jgi:hypothetical protein
MRSTSAISANDKPSAWAERTNRSRVIASRS